MPSFDVHPIMVNSDAVGATPQYTVALRQSFAIPRPVRKYVSTGITLGTSTSMAALPTNIQTPDIALESMPPPVNGTYGVALLECLLTFGAWSVAHAGPGDVRLGAQVVDSLGNVLVDTGVVGVDWTRQVSATGSVMRSRTVAFKADTIFGCSAQLMYAVSGSPTTKSVSYGYVELTPLRWRAP